jgi:hypothetical protein
VFQIADNGNTFAGDAIALCRFLTEGHYTAEELYQFVESMLRVATAVHELSEYTSQQFSQIRTNLLRVSLFFLSKFSITVSDL